MDSFGFFKLLKTDLVTSHFKTNQQSKQRTSWDKINKKILHPREILTLITTNFFSILYYNCEVWHLPTLKPNIKQHLLSASANALKLAERYPDCMESFINVPKV